MKIFLDYVGALLTVLQQISYKFMINSRSHYVLKLFIFKNNILNVPSLIMYIINKS